MSSPDLLLNPAWHALTSKHRALGETSQKAARYRRAISPFAALADDGNLEDLNGFVDPGQGVIFMCAGAVESAPGWKPVAEVAVLQMICRETVVTDYPVVGRELGADDVAQMLALAGLTDPGPFLPGTIEMGRYLGVETDGELIAMAGERFCLNGWTEVSGVCTHPSAEGRGLAKALVAELMRGIIGREQIPFLHVRRGSPSEQIAIRAYERLGFESHQEIQAQAFVRE